MRFAHISDMHLGFQRREALQKMERDVFEGIVNTCIEKKADFVLVSGDTFHVNIPEMRVQRYAFEGFRKLHEAGIPVYAIYGSHDFSPVSNSVIDLLVSTGYMTKVTDADVSEEDVIRPKFVDDPGTGARICGISGLKAGKDIEYYEKLDREALEAEPGFKIFMFHGAISEMKKGPEAGDHMPMSMLPRGFAYYAGGHMHDERAAGDEEHGRVVYPGTPFAGHYPDLAASARGQRRGFYMVEFGDAIKDVSFVETRIAEYGIIEVNGEGKSPPTVNAELAEQARKMDPKGRIIVVVVRGEMAEGKTADVDTAGIADQLLGRGAAAVETSRNRLSSHEYMITAAKGSSRAEIEGNVFAENAGQLKFKDTGLMGDHAVSLARRLLAKIGQPKNEGETNNDYNKRIMQDGLDAMGLKTDDP